jgi:glycosyltransferase involved in cell wall biosynthesis
MVQRFLPGRSRGGAGHFAHGLANTLVARGHAVTMFSEDPPPPGARYASVVIERPAGGLPRRLSPFAFPLRVARQDFSGFDIVHAQGDDQFIARRAGPPVVRTLHGSSLAEAIYNGWRRGSPKHLLLHLYFYAWELVSTLRADVVVAVSRDTGRHFWRLHEVVPNGVDLERFAPRGEPKSTRPSVLFVGELNSRKRGLLLVEAMRRWIRPRVPDAELWLVSPDRAEGEGIVWLGLVDDDRLAGLYRSAWVLCLPSSYEGFGRPYVEAMAAGTPVVATSNPGARLVLDGGRCGLIVDDRDVGSALCHLLTHDEARLTYARLGLERARAFAWDRVAQRYETIYDAAIAQRARRPAA